MTDARNRISKFFRNIGQDELWKIAVIEFVLSKGTPGTNSVETLQHLSDIGLAQNNGKRILQSLSSTMGAMGSQGLLRRRPLQEIKGRWLANYYVDTRYSGTVEKEIRKIKTRNRVQKTCDKQTGEMSMKIMKKERGGEPTGTITCVLEHSPLRQCGGTPPSSSKTKAYIICG